MMYKIVHQRRGHQPKLVQEYDNRSEALVELWTTLAGEQAGFDGVWSGHIQFRKGEPELHNLDGSRYFIEEEEDDE